MRLYAISDLHVGYRQNREAFAGLGRHLDDWLILGGDIGETLEHLELTLHIACERFAQVLWVPGNHELWKTDGLAGEDKYGALVALCRRYGVLTPEDPYPLWPGDGPRCRIAPLFLLYDYSFGPDGLTPEAAIAWAAESGLMCSDEQLLLPTPHASRQAWCHQRCGYSEARLADAARDSAVVLVNHFPLRRELAWLPLIPRFSIWCGTRRSEEWHIRFNAASVVFGHTHMRSTRVIDGVPFHEVSLGYPRQWSARPIEHYLREIPTGR